MTTDTTEVSTSKKFAEMVSNILESRGFHIEKKTGKRESFIGPTIPVAGVYGYSHEVRHVDGSKTTLFFEINDGYTRADYRGRRTATGKVHVSIADHPEHRYLPAMHSKYRATLNCGSINATKIADKLEAYFTRAVRADSEENTEEAKRMAHTADLKEMARGLTSLVDSAELFAKGSTDPIDDNDTPAHRVEIGMGGYREWSHENYGGGPDIIRRSPEFTIEARVASVTADERWSKPNGFKKIEIEAPGRVGRFHDDVAEKIFRAVAEIIEDEYGSGLIGKEED